jgi:hypothetical protein
MPLHFRSASFVPSVLLAVIVTLVFLMFPGELGANTHRNHTRDLRFVKKALLSANSPAAFLRQPESNYAPCDGLVLPSLVTPKRAAS